MGRRLLASYLSLALVVLLVLEIPLAITYARNERQNLTTKVERDAVSLASLAEDTLQGGGALSPARVAGVARGYTADTGGRVVIVDATGKALIDTGEGETGGRSFASRPEIAAALSGQVATGTRHSDTLGMDLLYVAVPVASAGVVHGAVRITYPTSTIDGRVHRYWLILAGIAAVVLAAAAAVGLRFARSIAGPLGRVEEAAREAGGDLSIRAPEDGPPEVASLARSFNETVAKVETLIGAQRTFVADASHQLRTPLAALRLRLENIARDGDAATGSQVDAAMDEVERLSLLVDGLMALARADQEGGPRIAADLGDVVAERVAVWEDLAAERGVALVADVEPGLAVRVGPGRLEQVLDNLIDNALDVAPSGSEITVSGRPGVGRVELHVRDHGPGMTAEERAHATDRFWRAPTAPAGGSGLGLAIVKRLVEADGGEIDLRAPEGGGLDAVVLLQPSARPRGVREPGVAPAAG